MNQKKADTTPLYTLQPLDLFSGRAEDYVKYRPTYPSEAIAIILKGLGEPAQILATDIGAGTGIASSLLAEQGVRVIAIEPNSSMREAAISHPLIEFREATAESTGLPDQSVDLITCFQGFHWFNPTPTLLEFHRILKPNGRLALIWNEWNANDKFLLEFRRIIHNLAVKESSKEKQKDTVNPILFDSDFAFIRRHVFIHSQKLDLPGVIGYAKSKSFAPLSGSAHQQLILNLQELHSNFADENGFVKLTFSTKVYLAKPNMHRFGKFLAPIRSKLILKWWWIQYKTLNI